MNNWKVVTSTYHLSVKFPTKYGVGEVQADQLAAKECYLAMLAMDEQAQTMNIEEMRVVSEPTEALEDIPLDENDPEKSTRIGADLEEKIKKDLIRFLRENIDVFAWSHEDMPGYRSKCHYPSSEYISFLKTCATEKEGVCSRERQCY